MLTRYLPNLLPKENRLLSMENTRNFGNIDSPELDTAPRSNKRIAIDLESVAHPTSLKLRVKWEANPFKTQDKTIKATFIHHHQKFKTINYIYENVHSCESVNLIYDNQGEITFMNTVKEFQGFECNDWIINNFQKILFTKPFATPREQDLTVQLLTRDQTRSYYATPRYLQGFGEAQPLFCYGAYYHPTLNIESIVPYYSVIRPAKDMSTVLEFKTQTELHNQDIYENNSNTQEYYFHDAITTIEMLTLANAIREGFCRVTLNIDNETITFKSYKFDEVVPEHQKLTIYFKL